MDIASFKPVSDFLLIEPLPRATTNGGIALPDGSDPDPQRGKVVAAGPGRFSEEAKWIENPFKGGEIVWLFFVYQKPIEVTLGRKNYMVVRARDVIGRFEEATPAVATDDCSQACCARPPEMALN